MQQSMSNLDAWKRGKYERTYCYMNTLTAKIVECRHVSDPNSWKFPKDIISSYRTITSNPNVEIIVEETNEQLGNARLRGAIKSLDAESNFDGVRKKEYKIAENANGLKSSGTSDSSNVGAKSAGAKDRRARRAAASSFTPLPLYVPKALPIGRGRVKCTACGALTAWSVLAMHKKDAVMLMSTLKIRIPSSFVWKKS